MSEYILEMQGIIKSFSGVRALDDVNFKVKNGEIHALCGENGAGKSTLMKILSGVYTAGTYEGAIVFEGKEVEFQDIGDSEKLGIAIIHQELSLVKNLSVSENIFMGCEPNKYGFVSFHEIYKKTYELLEELNLDINPHTKVGDLGIAKQQLIEIAKALSKNARLLILDEPTASLTEIEVKILMNIMKELKRKGVTCIYISHKLNEVLELADNVTVLRDGKCIKTEEIHNLDQNKIINMMVGRELKDLFPRIPHNIGEVFFEVNDFHVYDASNSTKKIVRSASFKLRKGEILGIAGLVGSGRTELVSSIFGTYEGQKEGTIKVEGKEIVIKNSIDALLNGIAMVPEDRKNHGIISVMSVQKNISLSNISKYKSSFNFVNKAKEIRDVRQYIENLKIKTPKMDLPVKHLSGGNQQKVVIAKNLLVEPKILILDEPTRGIDVGAKYEIYKLIFELVKEGISIIMVSSELPEILGISDRVLIMHEGEIKGEFTNENLTQEMIMGTAIGRVENGSY